VGNQKDKCTKMLEKSIIVSAHPDDEILWFSSIMDKVDEIVFCFLNCKSKPNLGIGRSKSLLEHPIKNISYLDIEESETFNSADWQDPVVTEFGIEISKNGVSDKKYRENYYTLKQHLKKKLDSYLNVFTHNPWGEYGNEEHVQVYRVVKELQGKMKFNLWFSNYCSNSSFNLMLRYISGFDSEYVTLKTNKIIGNYIKNLYKKNNCWTWYDDWEWFNEESFMKDKDKNYTDEIRTYGHIFPLNMLKFDPLSEAGGKAEAKSNFWRDLILRRVKASLRGNR
jgi:LmbE family N-acetylglucosaminyl deacetylase